VKDPIMQPRGQLWFALEKVCKDFKEFSGLPAGEALDILIIVLGNMLAEQKTERDKLQTGPKFP
jgi:hypothetical protein